ncbi:K+-dependent Na+/Ca+ exchanger homolog [Hafnia alvei]|uniref:K+-dependent Na+/Ca+ exchanger homolog n=1 Tax=Hafnia alvei TaxID=569 RepID=A0A377PMS6_HAFAL|nr:K+-dependent Na+/Ca+ exchanger homolog [Hafnia alvei]
MYQTITFFFLSAIAIYLACECFVNGIEWFGRRLNIGATAVGSVLAAFGTALPESTVTFMAVVFGSTPEQKNIGVGAAMGGATGVSDSGLCCGWISADLPSSAFQSKERQNPGRLCAYEP